MEGVKIILQNEARPATRTVIAVALATFISAATFAFSNATAHETGSIWEGFAEITLRSSLNTNTLPVAKGKEHVNLNKKKITELENSSSKTLIKQTSSKASSLSKFSQASRVEMYTALKSGLKKGDVPNIEKLAKFSIAMRTAESGGRYSIRPGHGSTISGAYQAASITWNNYQGYRYAYQAPRHVQDAWAFKRFITLWQRYNGDWERVAAHHFLPSYADEDKALWRKPLPVRFRAGNPPTIGEYVRRVFTHMP
jgi:hypothetical protein